MPRFLKANRFGSLIVFASLAFAAMTGGLAMTGCGGDTNSPAPPIDSGSDVTSNDGGGGPDVQGDQGLSTDTGIPDSGMPEDAGPDTQMAPCGVPTFVPSGGSVSAGATVTIVPPSGFPTTGGVIYYTTDGTHPTHTSGASSSIYTGPIQVNM